MRALNFGPSLKYGEVAGGPVLRNHVAGSQSCGRGFRGGRQQQMIVKANSTDDQLSGFTLVSVTECQYAKLWEGEFDLHVISDECSPPS